MHDMLIVNSLQGIALIWVSGPTPHSFVITIRISTMVVFSKKVVPGFCPYLTSQSTDSDIHRSRITDTQWITSLTVVCCITPFDITMLPSLIWVSGITPNTIGIPIRIPTQSCKMPIFYSDQIFQTKSYPKKSE